MSTALSTNAAFSNVQGLLAKMKGQIALALPRHLTPDRMIRVALTALRRSPDLLRCDPLSIVGGVVQASQLGLELDGILGHAYLLPFNNKKAGQMEAQFIVGYKGYLALAHRSGQVRRFSAHVVHEKDEFDFAYGTEARLFHRPNLKETSPPIAAYAEIATLAGGHDFQVLGWGDVLALQKKYGGRPGSPWQSHLEEMAKKSAIRRLAKRAPLSTEYIRAAALDEMADEEVPQDLAALVDVPAGDRVLSRLGGGEVLDSGEQASGPSRQARIDGLLAEAGLSTRDWPRLAAELKVPVDCTALDEAQLECVVAALIERAAEVRAEREEARP